MIPLYDLNPTRTTPVATVLLIGLNVVAFVYQLSLPPQAAEHMAFTLGVVPAVWTGMRPGDPNLLSFLSCMFLHGGLLHLLGNMLFLWIFGNNVEDVLGHVKFLVFYAVSGVCATLTHIVFNPASTLPVIGASGAISGVLGAYMLYFPRARVVGVILLLPPFIMPRFEATAFLFLGFYFVMQIVSGLMPASSAVGGVAWWAHIGGFIAGFLLAATMRRRY